MNGMETKNLFDLTHTMAEKLLTEYTYPWEALGEIKEYIISVGKTLDKNLYDQVEENIWISKSAMVSVTASISGPCIVGHNTEVRHCAFIRGSALIGDGCVVGNSTELKNCILFDSVQVPHFNYIGDSILGYKSHMGAGSVTSNVKSDKTSVIIKDKINGTNIDTGRKKCGAMLGDFAEVGCNAVLNPGTVIGRNSQVYPTSCVRGVIPEYSIFKNDGTIVKKH